jgi:ubiquinone/menaquinone biosynthesis C-methylase UbiE
VLDYDQELRRHHAAFRRACSVARTDHVLDIGCGAGETTREAARSASEGRAIGIDRSDAMIERADTRARKEGIENVSFVCADVETHAFPAHQLDIAISRFGSMFFSDPVAAFSNIRRALKPLGRLVMIVWQTRERNEWATEIPRALAGGEVSPAVWQAFSLGDPAAVRQTLTAAGFSDVTFDEVHEPVFYGADTESAFAFVSQFLLVQETLKTLDESDRKRALDRLRSLLEQHLEPDGVWFDSRAWIIAARCQVQ